MTHPVRTVPLEMETARSEDIYRSQNSPLSGTGQPPPPRHAAGPLLATRGCGRPPEPPKGPHFRHGHPVSLRKLARLDQRVDARPGNVSP